MPITLDKKLPAVDILRSENIFVMDDIRATHQDIRPMNVLILNLMPTKVATETPKKGIQPASDGSEYA